MKRKKTPELGLLNRSNTLPRGSLSAGVGRSSDLGIIQKKRLPIHLRRTVAKCSFCPPLQRRGRFGFSPNSLLIFMEEPTRHLVGGRKYNN